MLCVMTYIYYVTVSFDFEGQITYSLEGFSFDKPDRNAIKLDAFDAGGRHVSRSCTSRQMVI